MVKSYSIHFSLKIHKKQDNRLVWIWIILRRSDSESLGTWLADDHHMCFTQPDTTLLTLNINCLHLLDSFRVSDTTDIGQTFSTPLSATTLVRTSYYQQPQDYSDWHHQLHHLHCQHHQQSGSYVLDLDDAINFSMCWSETSYKYRVFKK